jgi:hypothetical protein
MLPTNSLYGVSDILNNILWAVETCVEGCIACDANIRRQDSLLEPIVQHCSERTLPEGDDDKGRELHNQERVREKKVSI